MGRINNENWVSQHRRSQGKFLEKQDIKAYLFDKKLSNGNNIQGKNRLNTDDLPNMPAILDYEPNLSRQSIIEPIDGGKAHTPSMQAFLTALTALSVISPNITVSSKKDISTDGQNSLSRTVKSFTEMNKTSIIFDTTAATTSTRQNHDESKEPITHNDNQSLIRGKREGSIKYTVLFTNQLHVYDVSLDIEMIKQKLKENSNITELELSGVVGIDSQKAQELGTMLKNSNISTISFHRMKITMVKEVMAVLKDTNITKLKLVPSDLYSGVMHTKSRYIHEIVEALKDTKVEELILENNNITGLEVIEIIKLLKTVDTKVKILNLVRNDILNDEAEDIASELRGSQITEVYLMQNRYIKPETLQKISMTLEENRHLNKESYTSTMESSTTKKELTKKSESIAEDKESYTSTMESSTTKEELTKKSESIAEDIVTDSSNNPAISTMSIGEPVGLTALAVSIIGAIGSTVIYVIKKFCGERSYVTHDALALAEPISDSHLDNNKDIHLTGVSVNNETDV